VPGAGRYQLRGLLSSTVSPGVARAAHWAATPPSCTTKSTVISPRVGSKARTL
jgi:hypothetical protein